jgi:hypothetical protein
MEYLYKTYLTTSLFLNCYSQDFLFWMPSLGLNFWKKQLSHTTNLHLYIYEEREIIYGTSFTTKEKLETIALKSLSASISS